MKSNLNKKNIFNKKMFIILVSIVFVYCVIVIGGTFAYLYMLGSDDETVTGDMANVDADLKVEKIVPTNNLRLVPLVDDALGNALTGFGGNSSCIDSLGNLSCEVYKITLKNTGTANLKLTGDITLVASGANNIFNNLKWEELEDATTRKSLYITNGMGTSMLDENFYLASGDSKIYYIAVWISEIDEDQVDTDKGKHGGIVHFYAANGNGITVEFGDAD